MRPQDLERASVIRGLQYSVIRSLDTTMKNPFLCGSLQTSSYGLLSAITSRRFLPGAIIFVATLQAGALTINPVFDGSITNLATAALIKNAFNQAAKYFQNMYSDTVTGKT